MIFALGSVLPGFSDAVSAAEKTSSKTNKKNQVQFVSDEEMNEMIIAVEPYVEVSEEGLLSINKDVPKEIYIKYNLGKLEGHFNGLNASAKNGSITINEDLTIDDNSFSTMAVYGKWSYHWWGYDRNFNNSQTSSYQNYLNTLVAGGTVVTGVSAWLPPVAAIAGVTTGYWALLSARVGANNKGNGVYVGCTWVAVFNVKPF